MTDGVDIAEKLRELVEVDDGDLQKAADEIEALRAKVWGLGEHLTRAGSDLQRYASYLRRAYQDGAAKDAEIERLRKHVEELKAGPKRWVSVLNGRIIEDFVPLWEHGEKHGGGA